MNNENGFILPFTMVTITIVLFALMTLIFVYEQEVVMTANIQEQFIVESLFARVEQKSVKNLREDEQLPEHTTYTFSDGTITVSYVRMNTHYRIYYDIASTNGTRYSLYQMYVWSNEQQE